MLCHSIKRNSNNSNNTINCHYIFIQFIWGANKFCLHVYFIEMRMYMIFDSKWICPKCVYLESAVYPEGMAMSLLSSVEMESIFYYDYCRSHCWCCAFCALLSTSSLFALYLSLHVFQLFQKRHSQTQTQANANEQHKLCIQMFKSFIWDAQ